MKRILCAVLCAAAILAAGCSGQDGKKHPKKERSTAETESAADSGSTAYDISGGMPVISIETVSRADDVMKFVTEPVAAHVSKQIASWTPGYVMPPAPYYEACTVSVTAPDGTELLAPADADVKVRGNWTTSYDKKPLRLKFGQKQNLLGLNGGAEFKNWVLLAGAKDISLSRDKAAFQLAKALYAEDGFYAADAQFAEVKINGEYWGVYLLTEQQEAKKNRVNISTPKQDETDIYTGYFLEFDGYYYAEDPMQQFKMDYAGNAPLTPFDGEGGGGRTVKGQQESYRPRRKEPVGFTIRNDIRSQAQHDFIAEYIGNVYRVLYSAAYEHKAYQFSGDLRSISKTDAITPREAVERVVNVRSLADAYILAEIACDADLYWSSFFMDVDFSEKGSRLLTFEAPWDYDSAFGNKDRCADGTGFYAANIIPDVNGEYETINPWLAVLMYEDWFQEIIREQWTKLYDSGAFERTAETILSDAENGKEAFSRNISRWGKPADDGGIRNELTSATRRLRTQSEGAEQLAAWIRTRAEFLNAYWHK